MHICSPSSLTKRILPRDSLCAVCCVCTASATTTLHHPTMHRTLCASELLLGISSTSVSRDAKRLLYSLAAGVANQHVEVDASAWQLTAQSPADFRTQILGLMHSHEPPARLSDLWRLLTRGRGGALSYSELTDALTLVGLPKGLEWLGQQIAKASDRDHSGFINERDFVLWLSDRSFDEESLLKKLSLRLGVSSALGWEELPQQAGFWTPEQLRLSLQAVLASQGLAPIDMLKAWDADLTGTLERREFMSQLKRIVDHEALWVEQLRDVGMATFKEVCQWLCARGLVRSLPPLPLVNMLYAPQSCVCVHAPCIVCACPAFCCVRK